MSSDSVCTSTAWLGTLRRNELGRPRLSRRILSKRFPRPTPGFWLNGTMASTEIVSSSPEQTMEIGRKFAERLRPPSLILLSGELGSGKTTITKGIISGLGLAREEE